MHSQKLHEGQPAHVRALICLQEHGYVAHVPHKLNETVHASHLRPSGYIALAACKRFMPYHASIKLTALMEDELKQISGMGL